MLLSEVMSIYNYEDLIKLLKKYNLSSVLTKRNPIIEKFRENWSFIGDNDSNASIIGILNNGEKGVVERISNAIDAVIERKKEEFKIINPKKSGDVVKIAFPHFYSAVQKIQHFEDGRLNAVEAKDHIIVAINDGKKSNRPSIDVIDIGTGIKGIDFKSTILSLHGGNKIKTDKNYLIGAFGQGGSTSLAFSEASIILSKINNIYYFTVALSINPKSYKNKVYIYLVQEYGTIIKLEDDYLISHNGNYEDILLNSKSGTLVRMLDCDISKQFRDNDITKPRMLHDYFNTELFNVGLPIKVVENRKQYKMNIHDQNRYVYGSSLKLKTSNYRLDKYSGSFSVVFKGVGYKINYYTILPIDTKLWGKDSECKKIYQSFNVHEKPIVFTVNGQYINGENFTKLKNAGLNFMQYRLLIHVDLDVLGDRKYEFFTTDRNQIISSDFTTEFIDKLVKELSQVQSLLKINQQISELAIKGAIDEDLLNSIADKVKNKYKKFLKSKLSKKNSVGIGLGGKVEQEEIFYDEILQLVITNKREEYVEGRTIHIILNTLARKDINAINSKKIACFLNNREIFPVEIYMNGRIQYNLSDLEIGMYEIKYTMFDGTREIMNSNEYIFKVFQNGDVNNTPEINNLNLEIEQVSGRELICDIVKTEKKITLYLCLDHDDLSYLYRGKTESEINEVRKKLIEPIALYTLFMDDLYDELESNLKNNIVFSLSRTIIEYKEN